MESKIFFGIRTNLITETQEALKREAERKKAEKESAEKMAEKTAEEMAEEMAEEEAKKTAEEEAEKEAEKRDKEILSFLEAFKKQVYPYDFVIYTGISHSILHLESFLPTPAGVSYDLTSLASLSAEKRAEIEAEMRKTENVEFFSSHEEAIDYMTSI